MINMSHPRLAVHVVAVSATAFFTQACSDTGNDPVAPAEVVPAMTAAPAQVARPAPAPPPVRPDNSDRAGWAAFAYNQWKDLFLTSQGANGGYRVITTDRQDGTVSEHTAYGMLFAAYLNDRDTFDGLWQFGKSKLNDRGLMAWLVNSSGNTLDGTAATDADEDAAIALIAAEKRWGGSYGQDARTLIDNLYNHGVEKPSHVLKPGDTWGGSDVTNPSYLAPGYYKVYRDYTGRAEWDQVVDASYMVLDNLGQRSPGAAQTGLVPDWSRADGGEANGKSYKYTFDACRMPWRLAHDVSWFGDPRAQAHLDKLNTFFAGLGAATLKSGYNLDGTVGSGENDRWHNATVVSMAAAGMSLSTDPALQSEFFDELIKVSESSRSYNQSLRLLGIVFSAGLMPNPMELTP